VVVGANDTGELVELWARLERLKVGIGGWIITGATMAPEEAIALNVDGHIRDLIDVAIAVKARIGELSGSQPQPAAAVERDVVGSPLSPVTGLPVVDLPGLVDGPDLARQLRERILRQRQYPAHRNDDGRRSA
jgi:hypothetical protein